MRTSNFYLITVLSGALLTACAQQDLVEPNTVLTNNENINYATLAVDELVDVRLSVLLEGPYQPSTRTMITDLNNDRGLLPGQELIGLGGATAAGQPYSASPWNFKEEDDDDDDDDDDERDEGLSFAEYPFDVVDWVLVAFRRDITPDTEIVKTAAWLHANGQISFLNVNVLRKIRQETAVYIVIEHRNHMGIMTPKPIEITNSSLMYDFSVEDSYKVSTSFGQKQLPTGEWVMLAGDCNQSDTFSYDINAYDKVDWVEDNGIFGHYLLADFNLDGDVNLKDKALWSVNNGKLSAVPK